MKADYAIPPRSGRVPAIIRRRRSTANRVLTILKAALNYAHQQRKISSDDPWRLVKPFREADAARIRYLTDDEAVRVVNGAVADFRPMIQAALLTGCRYGELAALRVEDFKTDAGMLHIRVSKSGKPLGFPTPDLIIVDEAAFGELIAKPYSIAPKKLISSKFFKGFGESFEHRATLVAVVSAMAKTGQELEYLRNGGISSKKLRNAADWLMDGENAPNISPAMSDSTIIPPSSLPAHVTRLTQAGGVACGPIAQRGC